MNFCFKIDMYMNFIKFQNELTYVEKGQAQNHENYILDLVLFRVALLPLRSSIVSTTFLWFILDKSTFSPEQLTPT